MDRTLCFVLVLCASVLSDCVLCHVVKVGMSKRLKREISCGVTIPDNIDEMVNDILEGLRNQEPLEFMDEININTDERIYQAGILGASYLTNITEMKISCDEDIIKFNTTLMMNQTIIMYNLTKSYGQDRELSDIFWMKALDFEWNMLIFVNTTDDMSYNITNSILKQPGDFIIGSNSNGMLDPFMSRISYMPFKFHIETILNYIIEKKVKMIIEIHRTFPSDFFIIQS